jgi:outer membrane protein
MRRRFTITSLGLLAAFSAGRAMAQAPTLRLSMRSAVTLATSSEGNPRVQEGAELVAQAESRAAIARAELLPALDGTIASQSQTRNLATLGFSSNIAPGGLAIPNAVGPFTVFDARVAVTQRLFDLSSVRRFQSARTAIKAAHADGADTAEQIATLVAKAYLRALRAQASVDAAKSNLSLADTLVTQAESSKRAGAATGIEITRAKVQQSNEQQRVLEAENERRRASLELVKAIGLPLDTPIELTDRLAYVSRTPLSLDEALARARATRADLAAQREREVTAKLSTSAVAAERWPSVSTFLDYGSTGNAIESSLATRTIGIAVRVPVFNGGSREARWAEAASQARQERIRTVDLEARVELEIRLALESLESAERQVKVAEQAVVLAEDEVDQARRRHGAGVTSSLEVTDAQTRLARARDNAIAALFNYQQAHLDLGQATGTVRDIVR